MEAIKSPCVDICELDAQGLCRGCLRTTQEIATWVSMSAEQRAQVMSRLMERRKN